jgi:phenylacetate-CoA ligase
MSASDRVYRALPCWAQHAAVTTYGLYWYWLRFGPGYKQVLKGYTDREYLTPEDWAEYTKRKCKELLSIAADHVPYYRETWSSSEKAAARAGRLEELPLLAKEPVRTASRTFLRADKSLWPEHVFHTSGSTGTPIATYWSAHEMKSSMAVRESRSARWASVSFGMPRATFSGRMVEPRPDSAGPFYRYNAAERQVYLSAFHLRPDTAERYVEALSKHGIQWLTGYAVSSYLLARFILEADIERLRLKAVITTSEGLTPEMRNVMECAYGCRIYEEYGTVENAVFASECDAGRLHVSPDVGVVELLRPDGSPSAPGEIGEVVATPFMREHHLFVRYRLGDLAVWDSRPCPCGRGMPVLKQVVGRIEDVVVGRDGRKLVRFHGVFTDQPNVKEGQVIQESRERLILRVVATARFSERDRQDLIARTERRLGPGIQVEVQEVSSIPRTRSGKFKAVVSLLEKERGLGEYTDSFCNAPSDLQAYSSSTEIRRDADARIP